MDGHLEQSINVNHVSFIYFKIFGLKTIFDFLGPISNILATGSDDGSDIYHIYWLWAFVDFSVSYSHNLHSL